MKNLVRVVLAVIIAATAVIVAFAPPASAGSYCYGGPSWYTFHDGETGREWTVPPNQTSPYVRVTGRDNVDPWNQWLMVCNDTDYGWGYVRLYSNATAQCLGLDASTITGVRVRANFSCTGGASLFYLCDYDGNFLQLRQAGSNFVVARTSGNYLVTTDFAGGNSLFTTTPRINQYMPYCDF